MLVGGSGVWGMWVEECSETLVGAVGLVLGL